MLFLIKNNWIPQFVVSSMPFVHRPGCTELIFKEQTIQAGVFSAVAKANNPKHLTINQCAKLG